ncbi:uncharacterized protein BP5553_09666 [Venustampulla echinocandica]|uniref:Uncharacterized protein n=1 Tax=Venustampulla echinocandica TaxID=2656787 RepID=A0A370TBP3_9HELO|nr:uncharacterized protein BP5553_09666 [Venustampulla echinocandica]RDL31457.1 hypothetical protein BP5553_09666 [Venustampulla echinocandica]
MDQSPGLDPELPPFSAPRGAQTEGQCSPDLGTVRSGLDGHGDGNGVPNILSSPASHGRLSSDGVGNKFSSGGVLRAFISPPSPSPSSLTIIICSTMSVLLRLSPEGVFPSAATYGAQRPEYRSPDSRRAAPA